MRLKEICDTLGVDEDKALRLIRKFSEIKSLDYLKPEDVNDFRRKLESDPKAQRDDALRFNMDNVDIVGESMHITNSATRLSLKFSRWLRKLADSREPTTREERQEVRFNLQEAAATLIALSVMAWWLERLPPQGKKEVERGLKGYIPHVDSAEMFYFAEHINDSVQQAAYEILTANMEARLTMTDAHDTAIRLGKIRHK